MSKAANYAQKTIEYSFYILFFFTPLILWPRTSEVFEFNKMLFVYLMTIIISTAWLTKSVFDGKFVLKRTPLDTPIFLFLLSQVLSTIFSIDTHTSVWGYYSRFHGGLASTVSYLILYYALVSHFDSKPPRYIYLLYSLLGSSLIVSTYGILERLGIDKNMWVQDVQNRVFSTLGQPNWLSAYLAALIPITLHFSLTLKDKNNRLAFLGITLLHLTCAIFTRSRSGIGAVFVGIFFTFIFNLRHAKLPFVASLLTILIFGSPWTPTPLEIVNSISRGGPLWPQMESDLNKLGISSQIKAIDPNTLNDTQKRELEMRNKGERVGGSDSFEIRKFVWQGAIKLGLQNPLFGTGLETFGYTYFTVKPVGHNLTSEWDFLYNKAHNEYLNTFANGGFVCLFTYLFLILSIIRFFITTKDLHHSNLQAGLLIGFLTILITNYFGFSVVNIALFFFLYPALYITITNHNHKAFSIELPTNNYFLLAGIWFVGIYSLLTPINQFNADLAYNKGKFLSNTSGLKTALDQLTLATNLQPNEPLYLAQLAETQSIAATNIAKQLTELDKNATSSGSLAKQGQTLLDQFITQALTNSVKAIEMNPNQTNFYKSRGKVGIYLATIDSKYYPLAIEALEKLMKIAPTDAKTAYNLGLMYENTDKNDKAKEYYDLALKLKPDYQDAKSRLEVLKSVHQ